MQTKKINIETHKFKIATTLFFFQFRIAWININRPSIGSSTFIAFSQILKICINANTIIIIEQIAEIIDNALTPFLWLNLPLLTFNPPNIRWLVNYFKKPTITNISITIIKGANRRATIHLPTLLPKLIVLPTPLLLSTDSDGLSGL